MQTIVVRCVTFIVFLNFTSFAENWRGWRGSLGMVGMGKAEGENYPITCSRDKNVRWRIDLQERGNSSLICENGIIVAMGVRAGGAGDVSATHQIWTRPREKQRMGFGVLAGGHVYILNEDGVAQCMEARQGKVVWEERLRVAGGNGKSWSSMVVSGDHLYAINQSGDAFVLRAAPKFQLLATNALGEMTQSFMAFAGGDIFVRTYKSLWCISGK